MKRLIVVPVLMVLAIIFTVNTGSAVAPAAAASKKPIPARCTVQAFRPFAAKVWDKKLWERGEPSTSTLQAALRRIKCAPPHHRTAMGNVWRKDKLAYYHYRKPLMWREHFKPFIYPDGERWAVPYPIAWCESGGNYYVGPSGAYGLIPPFPQYMAPKDQDEVAHRLYEEQGEGPWAPYESGCAYR